MTNRSDQAREPPDSVEWSPETADRTAQVIWQAWQRGELIEQLPPECHVQSYAEAHAAQSCLAERIGTQFGWKIAATSVAGQRHISVDRPLAGRLFDRYVIEDGGHLSVSEDHLHMRMAEAEFAFRVGLDGELADQLYLAIELPDSRFAHFEAAGGPLLVADNACGSRFVLGPMIVGWRELDLGEQPVTVRVNGVVAARGAGRNVLSGPVDALAWLANELPLYGEALRPGDIVTTGVATVPVPVQPGDRIVADFPSLGSVTVSFES